MEAPWPVEIPTNKQIYMGFPFDPASFIGLEVS